MTAQEISDLGKKILNTSKKKIRLTTEEIDKLIEGYITNSATEEESLTIAKHPSKVLDAIDSHNSERPTKAPKK